MNSSKSRGGSLIIYLLIAAALFVLLYNILNAPSPQELSLTELVEEIQEGNVTSIQVQGDSLIIELANGNEALAQKEPDSTLVEQLLRFGITQEDLSTVSIEPVQPIDVWNWVNSIGSIVMMALLFGVGYFLIRQFQGANSQAMAFGKSRARMYAGDQPTVTFDDVAGVDEAKAELWEVVEFLREPEKFVQLGARIPKGVLLVGAPGTGKTLLAKAVSGEAGVPFFSISGSEFVEMFVGVGASRVRDLFEQAKRHSPCIVFLDEIDAVGRHRGAGLGGSHDEREQTLNQILVEMDGFDTDTNVIIMAATNRPDILDPALLRPGRFDRRVVLDRPDIKGREAILKIHVRGKPLAEDVDLETLARSTPGFVGADIENLVNEAAILAGRENKKVVEMSDFQAAVERVIAGPERKSRLITAEEKRLTAYHESGHALVAHVLPKCDPVHKVSIVARGMAAGYTIALPERDVHVKSKSKFEDDMAFALGGRAAEEVVFGEITTSAASDLERVTDMARSMVTRYGMSERLGPMTFGQKEELVFLGREISEQRDYSEAVAEEIDHEVRQIVGRAYQRALDVLQERRETLDRIAEHLIEVETLNADDFVALFEGREPAPPDETPPASGAKQKTKEAPAEKRGPALDMPPKPALA